MTLQAGPSPWEFAARSFEPRPRRYRNPGHLGARLDVRSGSSPALDLIDDALVQLMEPDSPHNALAVFLPPQEGKSVKCSRRFPEWLLDHKPETRIAIVSYEQDTALRWGRDIKQDIAQHPCPHASRGGECNESCGGLHISIRRDSSAAGRWETPAGGGVYAVGIGGPLTGRPVDCLRGDTEILTQDGYSFIRDIHRARTKPQVLSFNHETGRTEWRPVIATREIHDRPLVEIRTAAGRVIQCTPDHRIYTPGRGYVPAAELRPGERLVLARQGLRSVQHLSDSVPRGPFRAMAAEAGRAAALQSGVPVRVGQRHNDLRAVQQGLHQAPVRSRQGEGRRVHSVVLLAQLLAGGYGGEVRRAATVRGLRQITAIAARPLLLAGMPASGIHDHGQLFFVRDRVRAAAVRRREEDSQRADGPALLARMHDSMAGDRHAAAAPVRAGQGSSARTAETMPSVRRADRRQRPQILLAGMPRGSQASKADQAMSAVRGAVHPLEQPDGLLRPGVRGRRPLGANGRRWQLALQGRHQLRQVVRADAPADPRTRPEGMPGLQAASAARPPHQRTAGGLPTGEPDPALRVMSHRAPQVQGDTVSVVRELRGERDTVYDLQVAGNRNFFAGEVLVHNCMVIDDPVKDRAAAESARYRDLAWDWYESVALTRLAPGARVVLVQTRWNQDDLAGRILSRPSSLHWKTISIPAIATGDDLLGRAPGEELPSVRKREPGHFKRLQQTMSPYVFSSIYQQTPTAAEGNFFRRATFRYWRAAPPWADGRERIDLEGKLVTLADCWKFITMDFAASTKSSADFTVAAVWAMTPDGDLVLLDRRRARVPDHEHFALVEPLRDRWNADQVYVESNWWSKTFVADARDHGMPVAPVAADTDKVTRAVPAAGRVHAGRVWFPAVTAGCECGDCQDGDWLDEWCDELASFPQGTHDDQADVLSYAARIATAEWTPAPEPDRPGLDPWERAIGTAHESATGDDGFGGRDLLDLPY